MNPEKMVRVSKDNPCPICGKPDWCLVASDGNAAICQRIEDGGTKRCGEAGWLHVLRQGHPLPTLRRGAKRHIPVTQPTEKDFDTLAKQYQQKLTNKALADLTDRLDVSADAMKRLCVGWNGCGYTFPMKDATGQVIGLRIRYPSGFKAAEKDSRNGLFIPTDLPADCLLLICEGETDTAAALDLGFTAVGRPSCNTGTAMLAKFAKGRDVVIVGDNDAPGRKGAEALASALALYCKSVRTVYPPKGIKDLRQWKAAGLTIQGLTARIEAARLYEPSISLDSTHRGARTVRHGR